MGTRTFVDSTAPIDLVLEAVELLRKQGWHPLWGYQRSVGQVRLLIQAEKFCKQRDRRRCLVKSR